MTPANFRFRQIHLDFHNSPEIPDIGSDWDAADFAATLKRAHVNSINLFAKCHHGMNYYPTRIGPVHPSLRFDMLGEQIEACHAASIKCPLYLSVGWEASAGRRHPEWRQVDPNGRPIGGGPLDGGPWNWPWMCLNNDYAEELLAQTEELLKGYECDGFWFDIVMYHPDSCLCGNCLRSMKKAGRDAANPAHRWTHTTEVAREFMSRASKLIRDHAPQACIFYNSRWGLQFHGEREFYSQIEIESLPTGGWGYGFYPLWSRFARTFDMPMLGMTGRFHRSWADWGGLKHPDALRFECSGILAAGGAVCIGDQLHPRGRLNSTVYEVIGEALGEVESVEEYCSGVRPRKQIGLLTLREPDAAAVPGSHGGALEGAAKILLELHHQFDVITTAHTDAQWAEYELLVVVEEESTLNARAIAERLRRYHANGGKLFLSHDILVDPDTDNFLLADLIGADRVGPSACVPDYFEITDGQLQTRALRPNFAYTFYLGPCTMVAPRPGSSTLARARESYFNRTWEHFSSHDYTAPRSEAAGYPAVTEQRRVVYVYGPVFAAYQMRGAVAFRELVGACLNRLIRPVLETNAPSSAEVSLLQQGNKLLVHLVNYHANRRSPAHVEALETPVPLHDVRLHLRLDEPPARAYLARSGDALGIEFEDLRTTVTVPYVSIHEIVVLEWEDEVRAV